MPHWLLNIVCAFAAIGIWTVGASLAIYFRDRSGNSGRASHWKSNPRLGDD